MGCVPGGISSGSVSSTYKIRFSPQQGLCGSGPRFYYYIKQGDVLVWQGEYKLTVGSGTEILKLYLNQT
jgi:hypothetical protein